LFAEDAPEKREATVTFFEDFVRPGVYDVYVSPVVIDEISRTRDRTKRKVLLDVVDEYGIEVLDIGERLEDIRGLAQAYVAESIVPVRQPEDALHIAIATVEEIDVLLSWNYKHIANVNKELLVQAVNFRAGYARLIRMLTPFEVIYEKD
jgi:predicted nucleic acid-binding protein